LSNSPRHLAKFNLIVPLYSDKLFSGLELQYNGAVQSIRGNTIDNFWLLNATLFSQKVVKNLDMSVGANNLLNQKIYHPGAGEHLQDQIQQDGITGWVKLTYKF
jgi:iron complex outermembrane receptor protein